MVGWFQGRMEWGPALARQPQHHRRRAERGQLEARQPEDQVPGELPPLRARRALAEKAGEWFDIDRESPYMLLVCQVKPKRPERPGDHPRGRVRATPDRDAGVARRVLRPALDSFDERTGCPVLINTSFNVRGEPIVCNPEDAYLCFMRTHMDVLVLGNQILLQGGPARVPRGLRLERALRARLTGSLAPPGDGEAHGRTTSGNTHRAPGSSREKERQWHVPRVVFPTGSASSASSGPS